MLLYFIPYTYGLATRAKSIFYKMSFIAYILIPNLLPVLYYNHSNISITLICVFLLAFTAMYSIYEIGYLQNDVFTTEYEKTPTYRLKESDRKYVKKHYLLLVLSRVFVVCVCCYLSSFYEPLLIKQFIGMLVLLYGGYAFYNSYRNRWNLVSIFMVLVGKYCAVPMLFIPVGQNWILYISVLLAVPLYRTVEEAKTAKRYGFQTIVFSGDKIDRTRMIYYLVLLLLSIVLWVSVSGQFIFSVLLFVYLFLFRLACSVAAGNKRILQNRKTCARVKD